MEIQKKAQNVQIKYSCKLCLKDFKKKSLLIRHEIGHSQVKPFSCDLCDRSFTQKSSLKRHKSIVHNTEKKFKCPKCGICFGQQINLITHVKILHDSNDNLTKYACDYCSCLFNKSNSLASHINKYHQDLILKNSKNDLNDSEPTSVESLNNTTDVIEQLIKLQDIQKNYSLYPAANDCTIEKFSKHERWVLLLDKLDGRHIIRKVKEIIQNGKKLFQCYNCLKKFKKKYDLLRHFRTHLKEKLFSCELCNRSFSIKSNLNKHLKIHGNSKTLKIYKCSLCDYKVDSRSDLNKHLVREHENMKIFKCSLCQKMFQSSVKLRIHQKNVHEKFVDKYLLKNLVPPIEIVNNKVENQSNDFQKVSKKFLCPYCCKYFGNYQSCNKHILKHCNELVTDKNDNTKITSPLANNTVSFDSKKEQNKIDDNVLKTNKKKAKNDSIELQYIKTKVSKKRTRHNCNVCQKLFLKPVDLRRHLLIHTNERNFECDICSKRFKLKCTLQEHIKIHSQQRDGITCTICGKKYLSTKSLKIHQSIHSNLKMHCCQFCFKTFRTSGHKKQHLKSHQKIV